MTNENDDYDSPWKDIIEQHFKAFMEFFFLSAAVKIDFEKGYTFLDKEFQKIMRDSELGRRFADKLIQVYMKNGNKVLIRIHIEVQGQFDKEFTQRMFVYHYRIFDRYGDQPVSLAVLADDNPNWKPDTHSFELLGCRLDLKFPTVKLLDYAKSWEELEKSENPFALVVMAHIKTKETKSDDITRKEWKVELIKRLYNKGYDKDYIIGLFNFIDWLMILPEDLDEELWEEVTKYEEERKMSYVTSVERIGIKKGIQQGLNQGIQQGLNQGLQQGRIQTAKDDLLEIVQLRFGKTPVYFLNKIEKIKDPFILKEMLRNAVTKSCMEDFMGSISI